MAKLPFALLIVGAASLAGGCIIESNNPPPPTTGVWTATWQLQDWNDSTSQPTTAGCPVGADTAIVYSLLTGDTNPLDATKDLFNCTDGGGTTADLPADSYTTWVEITDHSGATLYAQSNSQTVDVPVNGNPAANFPFQVNRGYVSAAWTLRGAISGNPLSCTQASATGVEYDETGTGASLVPDTFNCTDGQGTTYPVPIDTYTLSIKVLGGNPEAAIGPATNIPNVQVQYGNQLVNVGSVVLSVDGL